MINFFIEANFNFKSKKHIRKLIDFILIKENVKIKYINFIFCDDNFLLKINNKFLGHDFYTDVISFNYSSNQIEGEIKSMKLKEDEYINKYFNNFVPRGT